jgi:hypothetical protein
MVCSMRVESEERPAVPIRVTKMLQCISQMKNSEMELVFRVRRPSRSLGRSTQFARSASTASCFSASLRIPRSTGFLREASLPGLKLVGGACHCLLLIGLKVRQAFNRRLELVTSVFMDGHQEFTADRVDYQHTLLVRANPAGAIAAPRSFSL